jgi:hypothetical protein
MRGQMECSERYLAAAWNWSESSVHRFLHQLEENSMITRLKRELKRGAKHEAERFSICNYDTYNDVRSAERSAKRSAERSETNKDINKGSNKEIQTSGAAAVDSLPSVQSFQLSAKLKAAIASRDPRARAARVPDLTGWARDIDKIIRIDGRRAEDIEAVIAWCQNNGCFWGPNILSGRNLREKFDTMWGQMTRGEHGDSKRGCQPDRVGEPRVSKTTKRADFLPGNKGKNTAPNSNGS